MCMWIYKFTYRYNRALKPRVKIFACKILRQLPLFHLGRLGERLPDPGCTLSTGICASISQYLCPRSWSGSLKFTAYEFLNGSLFMIVWWTSYIFISLSRDVELCFTITQSITVKIMFFVGMQLEFKFRLKMWLVWSRLLRLEFYPHTAITHSMYHNLYKKV